MMQARNVSRCRRLCMPYADCSKGLATPSQHPFVKMHSAAAKTTGQATGLWQDLENLFSPIGCCAPIPVVKAAPPALGAGIRVRGTMPSGLLAAGQNAGKTERLLQILDTKSMGGQMNAERDGVWFVEGCRNDGTFYAFPNFKLDVIVRECAGMLTQTTVVLNQPCRMLAIKNCTGVKVLCDAVSDEILVVDCTNVEVVVGHSAPKMGVCYSTGVKFLCSCAHNAIPLIETRQSEGISCQCAMTRPGAETASEVHSQFRFFSFSLRGTHRRLTGAHGAGIEGPQI